MNLLLSPLTFLGSYFAVLRLSAIRLAITIIAGTGIAVSFLYFLVSGVRSKRMWKQDSWLLASLIFVILTAIAVGILRADEKGLDGMHVGRYRHYSSLAVCIIYLLFLGRIGNKKLLLGISSSFLFLGWLLSFYIQYGYSKSSSDQITASYYNGETNNLFIPQHAEENALAVNIIKNSHDTHNPKPFDDLLYLDYPYEEANILLEIDRLKIPPSRDGVKCTDALHLNFIGVRRQTSLKGQEFAVLRTPSKNYFIATSASKAPLRELLANSNYFAENIQAQTPSCGFPRGEYQVELWQRSAAGKYTRYRAGTVEL